MAIAAGTAALLELFLIVLRMMIKKVPSSKKHTEFMFLAKMAKIYALFITRTGEKLYRTAHTYIAQETVPPPKLFWYPCQPQ